MVYDRELSRSINKYFILGYASAEGPDVGFIYVKRDSDRQKRYTRSEVENFVRKQKNRL